ncbi:MAG: TetR/AcrR family transcriptional regulator [Acidimicrobiia bacterium]
MTSAVRGPVDGLTADGDRPAEESPHVADRIARRAVAEREAEYASEVRRLLEAGLAVISRQGTKSSPRVADIVAEAGLSNDVFYRHFKSKDDLVTAIVEMGTDRLLTRLLRQMDAVDTAEEKIGRWIAGVLNQASKPDVADLVRATMWNAARVSDDTSGRIAARESITRPILALVAELGSADPERDARMICQSTMALMELFLWRREQPTKADLDHLIGFCLHAVSDATSKSE